MENKSEYLEYLELSVYSLHSAQTQNSVANKPIKAQYKTCSCEVRSHFTRVCMRNRYQIEEKWDRDGCGKAPHTVLVNPNGT